jgi:hypothetical protein
MAFFHIGFAQVLVKADPCRSNAGIAIIDTFL